MSYPKGNETIRLYLMSGAGNRFTVLDNRSAGISVATLALIAPALSRAPFDDGLPTEGIITLQSADTTDRFTAEFFNPDGSHGAMCGNGGRCAVRFADASGAITVHENIRFTMAGTEYLARFVESKVEVRFPPAKDIIENIEISAHGVLLPATYVNVGSDHVVFFYDDLRQLLPALPEDFHDFDLAVFAPPIRNHTVFAPRGVNVNVIYLNGSNLLLRTFERGVEGETGACGTGALSAAIAAVLRGVALSPITLIPTSGRPLIVKMDNNSPHDVLYLEGDAVFHDHLDVEIKGESVRFL